MGVLVIPRAERRGAVAAPVVMGSVAGCVVALLRRHPALAASEVYVAAVMVFGPLVLALALGALMVRRGRGAFWFGFLFGSAYGGGMSLTEAISDPTGVQAAVTLDRWLPVQCAVPGVVVGGLALIVHWARSRHFFTIAEQDGTLCWRCGYCRGSAAVTICPECGSEGERPRLPLVWTTLDRGRRWARPLLALMLVVVAVVVSAWALQPRMRQVGAFYRQFGEPMGGYVDSPRGPIQCAGAWVALHGRPGMGLWISFLPEDVPGASAMVVRLARKTSGPVGVAIGAIAPPHEAALNRREAEAVLRSGLPESLLHKFETAAGLAARPAAPGSMQGR